MASAPFKQMDGTRVCPQTGSLQQGKQVVRPLRFFVSVAGLHVVAQTCVKLVCIWLLDFSFFRKSVSSYTSFLKDTQIPVYTHVYIRYYICIFFVRIYTYAESRRERERERERELDPGGCHEGCAGAPARRGGSIGEPEAGPSSSTAVFL